MKGLVRSVLLAESGLLDRGALRRTVQQVFAERRTAMRAALPQPPEDWARSFAVLAAGTGACVTDLEAGWRAAAEHYERSTKGDEG